MLTVETVVRRTMALVSALLIAGAAEASVLLSAQGNQLDAYDLSAPIPATTRTTPIPSHTHS
ncbi:MAG: hypothetical protein ACREQ9_02360, partial [Candidatus Binatia bacterium]